MMCQCLAVSVVDVVSALTCQCLDVSVVGVVSVCLFHCFYVSLVTVRCFSGNVLVVNRVSFINEQSP